MWYVSSGIWGNDPAAASNAAHLRGTTDPSLQAIHSLHPFALSARAHVRGVATGGVEFRERNPKTPPRSADNSTTGWFGSISKTTDGGKTFQQVFSSNLETDYWYFNSISCSSETHCVAVAEGDDAVTGGYASLAFVTFDGGVTWTNPLTSDVLPSGMVSMMGSAWVSDTEGWLGGTMKDGRKLSAVFFKTEDGGKTYSVAQVRETHILLRCGC